MNNFPNFLRINYADIYRNLLCQLSDCQMNIDDRCVYPLIEEITLIKVQGNLLQCSQYSKDEIKEKPCLNSIPV